jgi:hypothetical protein
MTKATFRQPRLNVGVCIKVWEIKKGGKKTRASDLHRTATTNYPCYLPILGDSLGAGRVGLAGGKDRTCFLITKQINFFF